MSETVELLGILEPVVAQTLVESADGGNALKAEVHKVSETLAESRATGGERILVLFFTYESTVRHLFGDFRSNQAGHRRSQEAHRPETHAVGTPRTVLSNAPGALVLPRVWTAPGPAVARLAQ